MEKIKKEIEIYKVGEREFLDKKSAKEYEAQLERTSNLKRFIITHNFDATEGRRYYCQTFVMTDFSLQDVRFYCQKVLYPEFKDWYGNDYYVNWRVNEVSIEDYNKGLENRGFYPMEQKEVFLSDKPLEGMKKNMTKAEIKKYKKDQ